MTWRELLAVLNTMPEQYLDNAAIVADHCNIDDGAKDVQALIIDLTPFDKVIGNPYIAI
jgi:hypothetical protein